MDPEIAKEVKDFAEKLKAKNIGVCFITLQISPDTKRENTTMITTLSLPALSLILRKRVRQIEKQIDSGDIETDPMTGAIKSPMQLL